MLSILYINPSSPPNSTIAVSASRGFEYGGSAAVVTSGLPTSPEKQNTISRKGRRFTSSFETEVVAILLAIEWVNNDTERHGPIIICTDS